MTTTISDQEALVRAIIANPDDDLPRLVYADWLEEHGQEMRAEFIRLECRLAETGQIRCQEPHDGSIYGCGKCEFCTLQIACETYHDTPSLSRLILPDLPYGYSHTSRHHSLCDHDRWLCLYTRRGFVHSVHVPTLETWRGGACGRCRNWMEGDCPTCHSSGHTTGIGLEIARWNPVQEVRVGNKGPWAFDGWWWNVDIVHEGNEDLRCDVPGPLFEILEQIGGYEQCSTGRWLRYPTEAAANAALSQALILEARGQEGTK